MFSGIITALEKPQFIEKNDKSMQIMLPIPLGWKLQEGDSVSVDGICLTVDKIEKDSFMVYCMSETLKRTTLSSLPDDHAFNLEQPLTLNGAIGGHMVSGHIDTIAKVIMVDNNNDSYVLKIQLPEQFMRYVIYKGSIAINGVSLTVSEVANDALSVSLIPYTLSHTNLGFLKENDFVNIEVDMIAKYIEKLSLYK